MSPRPGLKHTVLASGGVQLTLTSPTGQWMAVVVSASHAAAKAWGILADVDPAGVAVESAEIAARDLSGPVPTMTGRGSKIARILLALERGPATQGRIRELTGLAGNQVSGQCCQLVTAGRIKRLDVGAGRGTRAIWSITAEGLAWLEPRRPPR